MDRCLPDRSEVVINTAFRWCCVLSCAPDPVAQQAQPCDQVTSTCKGNNHLCGSGRGYPDEFSSTTDDRAAAGQTRRR